MTKAQESLRVVSSTTTVTVPEHFQNDLANCYHMHDLACGAMDVLAMDPAIKDHPLFDRALFAFYEAKRRLDELYYQFPAA